MSQAKGHLVGYVRVSSVDQNTARQLEGIEVDRLFEDKVSGKDTDRPALKEALAYVRTGDTLVVHSIDRLARNLGDLERIIQGLTERGVAVRFVKEILTFTGKDENPMNRLMLQMLGAFSQFERAMIRERQREGIHAALGRGVKMGRKPKLTPEQVEIIRERIAKGEEKKALAKEFGIARQTLYDSLADGVTVS